MASVKKKTEGKRRNRLVEPGEAGEMGEDGD
jgi:hypothetical protein